MCSSGRSSPSLSDARSAPERQADAHGWLDSDCSVPTGSGDQADRAGSGAQEQATVQRHGVAVVDHADPVRGVRALPGSGADQDRAQASREAGRGQRDRRGADCERPHSRDRLPGPGLREVGGHPEPQPGRAAGDARQPGGPVPGVRRLDRSDDRRGRPRHHLGARRVLHHRVGRRDGAVLRGAGARGRARGEGPPALRPPGVAGRPRLQGVHGAAGRARDRVASDAADRAVQGRVAPPRPAQPPQDPGGRRRCGVHRVAEPDRARLQLSRPTTRRDASRWSWWRAWRDRWSTR